MIFTIIILCLTALFIAVGVWLTFAHSIPNIRSAREAQQWLYRFRQYNQGKGPDPGPPPHMRDPRK